MKATSDNDSNLGGHIYVQYYRPEHIDTDSHHVCTEVQAGTMTAFSVQ